MAICFLLIAHTTHAEQGLVLNIGSKHFIANDVDYNEKNYGLGYTNYNSAIVWQVGFYNNSVNNLSLYAAMKFYSSRTDTVQPFFMLGMVTGYENYPIKPTVMLGLDLELIKSHKLNFIMAPLVTSIKPAGSRNYETDYGVLFALQYEKLF